jgi:hypothetical protein
MAGALHKSEINQSIISHHKVGRDDDSLNGRERVGSPPLERLDIGIDFCSFVGSRGLSGAALRVAMVDIVVIIIVVGNNIYSHKC